MASNAAIPDKTGYASSTDKKGRTKAKKQANQRLNFRSFQHFFTKFNNDWAMTFAGTLAYSLLMAVVPIMLAILSILGFVVGGEMRTQLLNNIVTSIPGLSSQQAFIDHSLKQLSNQAGFLALFAVLMAIFGGSRLFLAIEGCLDIVYRVRPRKPIPQNIMAISMMLLFIILVPIMLLTGTLPSFLLTTVSNYPLLKQVPILSWLANNIVTTYFIGFIGGLLAAFLLFTSIYIVVPNQQIKLCNSLPGALVAALAIEVFLTIVFPFYSAHFMGNYTGQAGFVVVLLVFFYYSAVILMLGAEVNAFFFEGVQPIPNDLATFVSTMAGKLNRDFSPTEGETHVNVQPTENADRAHITAERVHEEQITAANEEKQQTLIHKRPGQTAPKRPKHSWLPTLIEVSVGSLLAMVIQLLQMRRRK
jgi:YihY family inner membrane protein